tara:strand:+ start:97 stop:309 length:213 start_codon:yes stop_codon:yes gene_type:complete
MITKQKRNLINELSFWIIQDIEAANNNNFSTPMYRKENIRKLTQIVKSSKDYTNKEIKVLIHDLKFALPF